MMKWNTVSPLLAESLKQLMQAEELADFRLVGGTALSLHLGHRLSVDIDMFTDQPYDSIDFRAIDAFLKRDFGYMDRTPGMEAGMGRSYFIGEDPEKSLKLDIYYTDAFIESEHIEDGIRVATTGEIAAMKLDVISRDGRKKDFWDIHELLDHFSVQQMIELYKKRYPYGDNDCHILKQLINFDQADHELDPVCLKGKYWELIKYEIDQVVTLHQEQ